MKTKTTQGERPNRAASFRRFGVPGKVAVAAIAGTTRLIDNVVLGEDPAPSVRPE